MANTDAFSTVFNSRSAFLHFCACGWTQPNLLPRLCNLSFFALIFIVSRISLDCFPVYLFQVTKIRDGWHRMMIQGIAKRVSARSGVFRDQRHSVIFPNYSLSSCRYAVFQDRVDKINAVNIVDLSFCVLRLAFSFNHHHHRHISQCSRHHAWVVSRAQDRYQCYQ